MRAEAVVSSDSEAKERSAMAAVHIVAVPMPMSLGGDVTAERWKERGRRRSNQ